MGMDTKQVGGGNATHVSDEFSNFLLRGLTTGHFGGQGTAGTAMQGTDMGSIMDNLLSGGAAGPARSLMDKQMTSTIGDMRSRYSMGGTGYGTPGAVGEAQYRSQADPQYAMLGQDYQLKALSMLFPMIQQMIGIGTPQAQMIQTPSMGMNIFNGMTGLAGAAAPFVVPGLFPGKK
jgi:hypothetical protein